MGILVRRINGRLGVDWPNMIVAAITFGVICGILSVGSSARLQKDNLAQFGLILCFVWTLGMGGLVSAALDEARKPAEPEQARERL